MIASFPLIFVVNPKLPVKNVKELIAYAKANPAKANYASSAGIFQVATEMFKQRTGTKIELIPYKGSGESVQAVAPRPVGVFHNRPKAGSGPLQVGSTHLPAGTSPPRRLLTRRLRPTARARV